MSFSWSDVGQTLTNIAPTIAGVLTNVVAPGAGPIAAAGVQALLRTLGLAEDATPEQAQEVILGGNPETIIALKKLDQDFARDMAKIGIDLEQIAATDRASARGREIAVRDKTPSVLAGLVTVGFFALLSVLTWHVIPAGNETVLNVMLGALGAAFAAIVSYYYGSSVKEGPTTQTKVK